MDEWEEMRKELRSHTISFEFLANLAETAKEFPRLNFDALSKGQLLSKLWMIEAINEIGFDLGFTFILGGWYGILGSFLFEKAKVQKIISFDLMPMNVQVANKLNAMHLGNNLKFYAISTDVMLLDCRKSPIRLGGFIVSDHLPNTVINSSCEHMFPEWIDNYVSGTRMILQSTDYELPEHINTVKDLDEMKKMFPLKKIWFEGSKLLHDYNRFMLIGEK